MLQHHNLLEQMQVSSGGTEAEGGQRNQRLSAPQSAVSLRSVCGSVCGQSAAQSAATFSIGFYKGNGHGSCIINIFVK